MAKKEAKAKSKKKKKLDVDVNLEQVLLQQLVQFKKPTKVTVGRSVRLMPAYVVGRVVDVHHKKHLKLADPLTGEVFARSVPIKAVELVHDLSDRDLLDVSLKRASFVELEDMVLKFRDAVRALRSDPVALADTRLERLFQLLPEYKPGEIEHASAVPLDVHVPTEGASDETPRDVEGSGVVPAVAADDPGVDDADGDGGDFSGAAEPEGFGRDGEEDRVYDDGVNYALDTGSAAGVVPGTDAGSDPGSEPAAAGSADAGSSD